MTKTDISQQQIRQTIDNFLLQLYHKKADKELKQLAKARENNDLAKTNELLETLQAIQDKFNKANWMADAQKMAKQLKFGTHISKGIHPNAKGDNVRFDGDNNIAYVCTATINSPNLDANGNAAALPLATFFDYEIDNHHGIKIRDLILSQHKALTGCFADDLVLSDEYQQTFFDCLNSTTDNPQTHEYNKQLLWAIDGDTDKYHVIVPLYPSVLTHHIHQAINQQRYSQANKTAKDNRHKKNAEQTTYISIKDLAVSHLGGTKPQNVSQLISKQSGRTYLLPSMPPSFRASNRLTISKTAKNFFDIKGIRFYTHELLVALFKNISNKVNNANIRDRRDDIIEEILVTIIHLASDIQQNYPAGWSKDYNLSTAQQYWLDPQRAKLDTQFADARKQSDWHAQIAQDFAYWLQNQLRQNYKRKSHQFGTTEHQAWANYMKQAIAHSQALGEKVFL